MAYKTFLTFGLICEIDMITPTLLSYGEAHQEEFSDLLHIRGWAAGKLSLALQIFCWFHHWSCTRCRVCFFFLNFRSLKYSLFFETSEVKKKGYSKKWNCSWAARIFRHYCFNSIRLRGNWPKEVHCWIIVLILRFKPLFKPLLNHCYFLKACCHFLYNLITFRDFRNLQVILTSSFIFLLICVL